MAPAGFEAEKDLFFGFHFRQYFFFPLSAKFTYECRPPREQGEWKRGKKARKRDKKSNSHRFWKSCYAESTRAAFAFEPDSFQTPPKTNADLLGLLSLSLCNRHPCVVIILVDLFSYSSGFQDIF
ncbi:hypothetical protein CEXT_400391 [Caerostris extrusa]|uniref:Uncharacterized protein n=1 Tax=Caerostris extrusa TaxID=172846 RepID=A0AAV4Q8D9_CAEEX|nr:hypothetical protein CEXT_400391 [Caerostris extrusa]